MVIAGFALWQIAVALIAVLLSAYVRGLAGFGMAILLVPVLALALQPIEAVLIVNVLGLLISITGRCGGMSCSLKKFSNF